MKMNELYPSLFLKPVDIGEGALGDEMVVTIRSIRKEANRFDDARTNVILTFAECSKELILNVTNANTLAAGYGNETDLWLEREVIVFITTVQDPEGRSVPGIRLRIPKRKAPADDYAAAKGKAERQRLERTVSSGKAPTRDILDDDVPF